MVLDLQVNEIAADTVEQFDNLVFCWIRKFRLKSTKFYRVFNLAKSLRSNKKKVLPPNLKGYSCYLKYPPCCAVCI